jgi:outer membrane biosynthesis protein TonB
MAFVNNFLKALTMPIGDLAKWLEEEHRVPAADTIEKWNELTGMKVTMEEDNSVDCEDVEDQTINIEKNRKIVTNTLVCQHVFLTGLRKGQQCTIRPKDGDRCSAHKNKEKKEPKPKKEHKPRKNQSKEIIEEEDEKSDSDSEQPPKKETKVPDSDGEESEPEKKRKPAPKKKGPKRKMTMKVPDSDDDNDSSD